MGRLSRLAPAVMERAAAARGMNRARRRVEWRMGWRALRIGLPLALVAVSASAQEVPARVPLEWVLGGAPSEDYGSTFVGCELRMTAAEPEVVCPNARTLACSPVATRDLTPDAGDERVYGCGTNACGDPALYPVVAVVSSRGPVAAIATTADMSCGSSVSFVGAGRRARMVLAGGGEDGTYRATYGWRRGRLARVAFRYREATY